MPSFADCISNADAFLWGPPLLILLLGTHLFFTVRLKFIQRHLITAFGIIAQRDREQTGSVSAFSALAVALASTIGTGNVIGVATAVCLGGPGAVFWCLITGIFGMATKYAESLLAVKYRKIDADGEVHGGPMYTIWRGLRCRSLAIFFCIAGCLAVIGIGNLVQANAISAIVKSSFAVPNWVSGAFVTVVAALVILGGLRSIARVCTLLVPLMTCVYLAGCLVLIVINRAFLADAALLILRSAFSPAAAGGGLAGYGFMLAARYGVARGLFSNEAGMGSEPIVAATAKTRNAVRQGLVSYTGTFCTIIICLLTGMVLVTGLLASGNGIAPNNDEILPQTCFEAIPYCGKYLLSFAIFAFASTTMFGWFYYGEECVRFLCDRVWAQTLYKFVYLGLILPGAVLSLGIVWDFANFANGLMVIPNVISLLLLQKTIVSETRKYLWSGRLDAADPDCAKADAATCPPTENPGFFHRKNAD